MAIKINDKFKKKQLLGQVANKWGFYHCEGNLVFVKNCILNEKYTRIFQVIEMGDSCIDGVYLINSFDINVFIDIKDIKTFEIIIKKYDKIIGLDGMAEKSFTSKQEYYEHLFKKSLITQDDISMLTDTSNKSKYVSNMYSLKLENA